MIVVDTNVVAYLLLRGPQTAAAEALLEAHPTWAAPPLWRSEWRNVLCGYLRRGTLSLEQVIALQEQAETLVIGHEEPVQSEDVLKLAASSGCSAYDCEFVAAAQQLDAPLVTADRALLKAFPALTRPLGCS
ncbi:MAG: type II toxin-antitoxin system VapC family toxin [Synechococcus lacustris]